MEQEYENMFNNEELSAQLIQECIANLRWKKQEREERKRVEVLAARKAEKTIPLPAYMKVNDEGFLQYEESSCLPTPNGENIGIRPIGSNITSYVPASVGQVTEKLYSVDEMILLAGEFATNELIGSSGSELLYQKVWAHVKSTLPIECKEDYVKSMVRSAIVMYLEKIRKPGFRPALFDDGEFKINIDESSPHMLHDLDLELEMTQALSAEIVELDITPKPQVADFQMFAVHVEYCSAEENYDRAMKFVV